MPEVKIQSTNNTVNTFEVSQDFLNEAKDRIAVVALSELSQLLEGAEEDITKYAEALATDTVAILQEADQEKKAALLAEVRGQAALLAEAHRLRVVASTNQVFMQVVSAITRTGLSLLTAGVTEAARAVRRIPTNRIAS